jgi:hypothetical protein
MSVVIDQPEIELLIERRMASGAFEDIEGVLLHALTSAPMPPTVGVASGVARRETLEEMFAKVRGLADDLDFSRDPSPGRTVDLT